MKKIFVAFSHRKGYSLLHKIFLPHLNVIDKKFELFFDTCSRPHAMRMPKLLPSNAIQEKIQEKCTPEIHSNAVGTSRNSDRSPIYLGIPFFNGQCGSKMSSSLESWFKPYLQVSLSLSLSLKGNLKKGKLQYFLQK